MFQNQVMSPVVPRHSSRFPAVGSIPLPGFSNDTNLQRCGRRHRRIGPFNFRRAVSLMISSAQVVFAAALTPLSPSPQLEAHLAAPLLDVATDYYDLSCMVLEGLFRFLTDVWRFTAEQLDNLN